MKQEKACEFLFQARRFLLRSMAIWLFILGVGGGPAFAAIPTKAVDNTPITAARTVLDIDGFKQVAEALTTIIKLLGETAKLIVNGFNAIFEGVFGEISTVLAVKHIDAVIMVKMKDYEINADANDKYMYQKLTTVMKHIQPGNAHLCRKAFIHQRALSLRDYQDQGARLIVNAWVNEGRGPGEDSAGPKGAARDFELRCRNKYGNPVEGYPSSCVDLTTKVGRYKRTFVDADLLGSTVDGAVTLEMPKLVDLVYELADGQSMTVSVAQTSSNEQKMWLAAMNYCYQLAGPKPTPPNGDAVLTQAGAVATGLYRTSMARGSQAVDACAKLVMYYTRPNEDATKLTEEGIDTCKKAVGTKGTTDYLDDATMAEKFDGCKKPLSPYQVDMLENLVCKSTQEHMMQANSGVLVRDAMVNAVMCNKGWIQWEQKMADLNGNMTKAVELNMRNRKLFDKVQKTMSGK